MPITIAGFGPGRSLLENLVNTGPLPLDDGVTLGFTGGAVVPTQVRVSGLLAEDRISIQNQSTGLPFQIGVSGTTITYGSNVIGSFSGGVGADLVITLQTIAAPNLFVLEALLNALTFADVSDTPTANRVLTLSVRDQVSGVTTSTATSLTVVAENDVPVITSGGTAGFAEDARNVFPTTDIVYQATGYDPDGTSLGWSLSGVDAALFTIDEGGKVRFRSPPNYEEPADSGRNNVYDLVVNATDGVATTTKAVAVTVADLFELPYLYVERIGLRFDEATVNAGPQPLGLNALFTSGDFLAGLHVLVTGLRADDRLSVLDQGAGPGQIGFDGVTVRYGGVAIATVTGGFQAAFDITLNGQATDAAVTALLHALTFENTSDAPAAYRTLHVNYSHPHISFFPGIGFGLEPFAVDPFAGIDVGANSTPSFADLNADGRLDLVVGNATGTLSAWLNLPTGFTPFTGTAFDDVAVGADSAPVFASPGVITPGSATSFPLTLYVGSSLGLNTYTYQAGRYVLMSTLAVAEGSVSPAFGVRGPLGPGVLLGDAMGFLRPADDLGAFSGQYVPSYSAPSFGRFADRGNAFVVLGGGEGTLRLLTINETDGQLLAQPGDDLFPIDVGTRSRPAVADIDGDGRPDLVVGNGDGTLVAFRNFDPLGGSPIMVAVTPQNDAPSGTVILTADEATLFATAALTDPDGLGTVSLHWQALQADTWIDIPGATGPSFVPGAAPSGLSLRAVARYVDAGGTAEEVAAETIVQVGTAVADRLTGTAAPSAMLGGGGNDRLTGGQGAETLVGGNGRDVLKGNDGADLLFGGAKADKLSGGTGADTLVGGLGADSLSGGADADVFRFLSRTEGADTITDFTPGLDLIAVRSAGFGGLPPGPLGAGAFALGTPLGKGAQFVYDPATGALAFDRDGAGSRAPDPVATLTGAPAIGAGDILVVA